MDRDILNFVAKSMGQPEPPETGNPCAFCYKNTASIPYKKVIGTNTREQFYDNNNDFCPLCAYVLNEKSSRTKNWIITEKEIYNPTHAEVWTHLMKEYKLPNVFSLTTTYKKHQFPYGEINYSSSVRRAVLDQKIIKYDLKEDKKTYDIVHLLYNEYKQPKKAILSKQFVTHHLEEEQFYQILHYGEELLKVDYPILYLFCTYVQKEEKNDKS